MRRIILSLAAFLLFLPGLWGSGEVMSAEENWIKAEIKKGGTVWEGWGTLDEYPAQYSPLEFNCVFAYGNGMPNTDKAFRNMKPGVYNFPDPAHKQTCPYKVYSYPWAAWTEKPGLKEEWKNSWQKFVKEAAKQSGAKVATFKDAEKWFQNTQSWALPALSGITSSENPKDHAGKIDTAAEQTKNVSPLFTPVVPQVTTFDLEKHWKNLVKLPSYEVWNIPVGAWLVFALLFVVAFMLGESSSAIHHRREIEELRTKQLDEKGFSANLEQVRYNEDQAEYWLRKNKVLLAEIQAGAPCVSDLGSEKETEKV